MNTRMRVDHLLLALAATVTFTGVTNCFAAETPLLNESPAAVGVVADSAKGQYVDPVTGMELLFVKGGCFQMGDEKGNPDEKPVHEVCVSDFYMGKYEVKRGEWDKVMGTKISKSDACGPDCPVGELSWLMAQEFINVLNDKGNSNYRLPTEAEWEYAARSGGKQYRWSGTNSENDLTSYARYSVNSESKPPKAGSFKPNALGFHDMSGYIEEWCLDWYKEDYYKSNRKNNPTGPVSGERRVLRGGASNDAAYEVRTSVRDFSAPDAREGGFRLVLPVR